MHIHLFQSFMDTNNLPPHPPVCSSRQLPGPTAALMPVSVSISPAVCFHLWGHRGATMWRDAPCSPLTSILPLAVGARHRRLTHTAEGEDFLKEQHRWLTHLHWKDKCVGKIELAFLFTIWYKNSYRGKSPCFKIPIGSQLDPKP